MTAPKPPRPPWRPPLPEHVRRSRVIPPVRLNARESGILDTLVARWACSAAEAVRKALALAARRKP